MASMLELICSRDISVDDALIVHITVITENHDQYVHSIEGSSNILCRYCHNVLLNSVVETGQTLNLSNSPLARGYGISHIIIKQCFTQSGNSCAVVSYLTKIIIDTIHSNDFYTSTFSSVCESLGNVSKIVEQIEQCLKVKKFFDSTSHQLVGILLHGPHGSGKSALGKYLSKHFNAVFIDVKTDYHCDVDTLALEKVFSRAISLSKEGLVLVFFDNLDFICPSLANANSTTKEITATLINEMDNLYELKIPGVLVIGATNSISSVNASLRKHGRFEKEILVNVPTTEERTSILEVLTSNIQLDSDVSLREIALWTPGYVGRDLKYLCKEACDSKNPDKRSICRLDFYKALNKVPPSISKSSDIFIDIEKIRWGDIGGLDNVKAEIRQSIEWPFLYPKALKTVDLATTKGILLYGPPGCCKTTLVRAAATSCNVNFITLNGAQIYSSYVGESEKFLSETFQKARALSPCIIFFDEFESLVGKRASSGNQSHVQERILSTLLNEMDGIGVKLNQKIESTSAVMVIGATNRPDMIDSAILRPGRIDKLIYVPPPDEENRQSILKLLVSKMPCAELDIDELSKKTEHFSGADLKELCKQAGMICLQENMNSEISQLLVTQAHFTKALKIFTPSLSQVDLQLYSRFKLK